MLFAAAYALFRFKVLDSATKYVCAWLWLGVLTEIIGQFSIWKYQSNLVIYSISAMLELLIICLYFNQSVARLKAKNRGVVIAIIGLILGILNALFLQPLNSINSNFLFLECLIIVSLALYAIFRMLIIQDIKLRKERHFWFASTFLFYQCCSIWYWGSYVTITTNYKDGAVYLTIANLLVNIIVYTSFAILFIKYPKTRHIHV